MGEIGDVWLVRLRITLIAVGFVVVGAAAGGIFDRTEWTLAVSPVAPAAIAAVLIGRRSLARLLGAAVGVVVSVVLAVTVGGGSAGDVATSFSSGVQGLLSTDWPSPALPDLIGTVAAALAMSCAAGAELAARRRLHLVALLPLLFAYLAVIALSAPLGVRWVWLACLAAVSIAIALVRNDGTLRERVVLLRGERRLIPLLGTAIVLVALAAIPLSPGVRADPRRNDPADQTAPLLDPIEVTLALRNLDPPVTLHLVTANDGGVLPVRWRTAALTSYDGRRWSPSLTVRPIGSTLGTAVGPTIDADVSFLDDSLTLVPLPGRPVSVDAPVETDADRTVVRLAERPSPGDVVRVVANTPVTPSAALGADVVPRIVDESTAGLTTIAEGLAGDGDAFERLARLETTLRDDFVLDSDVQGGGLEQALIDRFLRDTQRGTSEQFATAFVLLARSLGLEARVATGYLADGPDGDADTATGSLALTSADAEVWPEVQLTDGSWLAYDPVPPEEAADGPTTPPEPQVQTPAAPQPPIAPPPEADTETTPPNVDAETASDSALSTALAWAMRGTVVISLLLLPFVLAGSTILGVKYRRRRRRLAARDPSTRIRGAWASATDALVDAGLHIELSTTDSEIAGRGTPYVPQAARELERLALLSGAATFGTPRHPDLLAEDATACLGSVEDGLASVRTRWQRLRWRLSLRSLRPATRSPVTD